MNARETRPNLYCVEIRTNRWDTMVQWYRQTLGLRVLVRVVEDGYALIEAGETRIALLSREQITEPNSRWSLGFEVDNLTKLVLQLEAARTEFHAPRRHEEGFNEILTADPDGNVIRLFSWPDAR